MRIPAHIIVLQNLITTDTIRTTGARPGTTSVQWHYILSLGMAQFSTHVYMHVTYSMCT